MAGVTLDAGVLIALDRGDRRAWGIVDDLRETSGKLTVPAPVLAQAWRGSRNARLAMALRGALIEALDEHLARLVGELCGRAQMSDVVDAAVVVSASSRGDTILTSDPRDLFHLAAFVTPRPPVIDLTRLRLPDGG